MNVELIEKLGSDLSVVNAARVSFSKRKDVFDEKDEKLIKYLADHNHWSPFGHATLQFLIKAPVFVARQLVKKIKGIFTSDSKFCRTTDVGNATRVLNCFALLFDGFMCFSVSPG